MSEPVSRAPIDPSSADVEPRAGSAAVPMWMVVVPLVLFFWGALYFDRNAGWFEASVHPPFRSLKQLEAFQPATGGDRMLVRGKQVYDQVCALCHGTDGAGKPGQAPTLIGTEWVVTENIGRLIRIPLQGLSGPIVVNGVEWNMAMPAMGAALSDEDLAALLSYTRNAWGNEASKITTEDVRMVREATRGRMQPWSAAELLKLQ